MRGRAAIIPVGFAVFFGVVNGIAIFQPLVIEQRRKSIREQNGTADYTADEAPPSDKDKKLPVRLATEANDTRDKQLKELDSTGVLNPLVKMRGEGELEAVKVTARWYQFWK